MKSLKTLAVATALVGLFSTSAVAQMINVSSPFSNVSDSYYERNGVNFGFNFRGGRGPGSRVVGLSPTGQIRPNIHFSQNSAGSAVPPFGGFDPNTQGHFGFGVRNGGGGFDLGLSFGKGNTRSNVVTTPSVTMMNGQVGSIFSGQQRPFVTGITPVLGNQPIIYRNSISNYLLGDDDSVYNSDTESSAGEDSGSSGSSSRNSTAQTGDLSVSEIKRQRAAGISAASQELTDEIMELVNSADELVNKESFGAARAKYSRAIRKIGDNTDLQSLRETISAKLKEIKDRR